MLLPNLDTWNALKPSRQPRQHPLVVLLRRTNHLATRDETIIFHGRLATFTSRKVLHRDKIILSLYHSLDPH